MQLIHADVHFAQPHRYQSELDFVNVHDSLSVSGLCDEIFIQLMTSRWHCVGFHLELLRQLCGRL